MSTFRDASDGVDEWGRFYSRPKRTPDHPPIELCLKTDSEDGSAIYHPDEMHDPAIDEPWILIDPDGGLVHVANRR